MLLKSVSHANDAIDPLPTPQARLGTISGHDPFQRLLWDVMGPLPVASKGHKYILVASLFKMGGGNSSLSRLTVQLWQKC